jgi:hypothetical protein
MGSWLRVAVRRAKVWRTLDRELGTHDALIRTAARVRAARKGQKLKWKAGSGADEHSRDGGGKDPYSDHSADCVDSLVDTNDLLPYMGRLWMDFPVPSSAHGEASATMNDSDASVFRVQWRIEFDWTGEATSQIGALARLPRKCNSCLEDIPHEMYRLANMPDLGHRADKGTTLSGITALFDELLQRGEGVVTAVETIVTLLAGDPRG